MRDRQYVAMCYSQLNCGLVSGSISVCAECAWASACVFLRLGCGVKTGSTEILYVPAAESVCCWGNEAMNTHTHR